MKKVLIFGYSGFVGPYLAAEFINHKYVVYGSDIVEPRVILKEVCFFKNDILNFESISKLLFEIKPDIIVNLAAISSVGLSWKYPQKTFNINVVGAINILESVVHLDEKPLIMFVGSSEEYLPIDGPIDEKCAIDSNNPYGASKISQELLANLYKNKYGLDILCVRSFNHTGIGQKESFVLPSFCKQVAEIEKSGHDGVVEVGNIDVFRDFLDVRDVVRAYRMIIECERTDLIFNIGSSKAYSLRELLGIVVSFTTKKVEVHIKNELLRITDAKIIKCNNDLLRNITGWKPEIDIKDTLFEMYEFYLKQN